MPFFLWNEKFSVGNPAIDMQHRKLVDLSNELFDAIKSGKGQESLLHVFNSLIEYSEMHFRSEEAIFNLTEYPDKESHIREHRKLLEEAHILQEKFHNGTASITTDTLDRLKDWLVRHMQGTDMSLAEYL